MRAIVIQKQGAPVAPNIVSVDNWVQPGEGDRPGPGQVLIRTECSALNRMDLWVGSGVPGLTLTYPRVSGCDACGRVEAIGEGVDASWMGQRVIVNAAYFVRRPIRPSDPPSSSYIPDIELFGEHTHGMHRERFMMPVEQLAVVGDNADPAEAAAFGLVALTAWSMMFTKGQLRPGQSVLITGIGGGVATAALSIAKWMACPVAVTSRHQWKLDRAKALGADLLVLDTGEDWSKQVRAWTGGRGVDMAVDSTGKPTHLASIKSLTRGGAYVTPGNTGGPQATTDLARVFWNQLRILGSTMGTTDELRELAALFRAGYLHQAVDNVIPWHEGQKAWQRLESSDQFGKVVIDWR